MPIFKSKIAPGSDSFQKNRSEMLTMVDELRALEQRAVDTSNKRLPVFEKRGQLSPRERIKRLLDPGMPFLSLFNMANYMLDDENPDTSVPGGSNIIGIGFVSGVRCMVWSDDSGIRAGAATTGGWRSLEIMQEMCMRQKLPLVHLVESAGANLVDYEVELWANGGKLFRNLARMSSKGLPTMVVLHGASTAGGAYMPGMSDYVIGVKDNGMAALAGAALVKAATGEIANDRELGGTEMHSTTTGLIEYLADDDAHGIALARDVMGRLGWNKHAPLKEPKPYAMPAYSEDELAGVVPKDYTTPYDVREVMARIVDGSDFEDFKPRFGVSTVCIQASVMGHPVAMIGNNGPIDPNGANKVSHFLQLCEQSQTPVVFLHNTTGYMVGTQYEQAGMIKHGSKMIQAVSTITVPKISFHIGASFGAGNYGMAGYAYDPEFLFSWVNARTGVMSGASAAKTMRMVAEVRAARKGETVDEASAQAQEDKITALFTRQESALYTSGRCLDHGVIDPRDTRKVLGFVLDTIAEGRARKVAPNSFAVARA
ncbi:acyl-CoA carboxylase subunit beta [Fretibacter rubidus]|uniref:acyl-CoA carboxylase subunit beta n=1 Tax=Fretibacter rubidus TaxID=570162 RepID=UPI00352B1FB1